VIDHSSGAIVAVVDDDPSILRSLEYLLASADLHVCVFASAAEMLESDCLGTIDCLISDIDMPVTDGFELLRVVHDARPELPILLITGHPDMLDRLSHAALAHHRSEAVRWSGAAYAVSEVVQKLQPRVIRSVTR
jgi:FixJ family two-component response regulator